MFFNLPTLLTWARIVAIPLIVGVFHLPLPDVDRNLIATVLFIVVAALGALSMVAAESRRAQPFQWAAWQGAVKDVPGMLNMHKVARPLWEKSLRDMKYVMTREELEQMSEVLQEAQVDDLALVTRQIFIVRQGRYMPTDHPFISKSLRRLAPGPQTEQTLKKLGGNKGMATVQLFVAPVPGKEQ